MNKIYLNDLKVKSIIGVAPQERHVKQELRINITITADFKAAIKNDDINAAINYQLVEVAVIDFVEKSQYFLLETLAHDLAQHLLQSFHCQEITVEICKLQPFMMRSQPGVSVSLAHA